VIDGPDETALSALASLLAREFHVIALTMPGPSSPDASAESVSTRDSREPSVARLPRLV
jgi:hypothetical protein